MKLKNEEFYENLKNKYNIFKNIFSVLSILLMLSFPIFSILTEKGNLYINISVLVVSLIYSFFWLTLGSKKKFKINRIYKWSRLILSAISLGINAYSVYITMTNFSIWSVILTSAMGGFLFFNITFNILYDVVSVKLNKFIAKKKEEFSTIKEKFTKKSKVQEIE